MQIFFSQGITILCSQAPDLGALRLLLERHGYVITAMEESSEWPEMQGPCLTLNADSDNKATCWVDICDFPWPDDLGTTGEPTQVTTAHAMGAFGPFAYPGALERAMQVPGYEEATNPARSHRAFVRMRIIRLPLGSDESPDEMMGDPDPLRELPFLIQLAAKVGELPEAGVFFNPNSELLLTFARIHHILSVADEQKTFPLEPFCRYRGCRVDETWSVVDSIGMAQLGLRDFEFAWPGTDVTRQEQIGFMLDLLHYQVDKAAHIAGGHSTDGPKGKIWYAEERAASCMVPPRQVLHWTLADSPPEPPLLAASRAATAATADETSAPPAAAPERETKTETDSGMSAALQELQDKINPWLASRDSIRVRAIAWLRSPEFRNSYYYDAHFPPILQKALQEGTSKKEAAAIWKQVQIFGQQTPDLWNQYQQLGTQGQVWLAVPLMVNPAMKKQPHMLVPCGLVVPVEQTAQDMVLAGLFADAAYSTYVGEEDAGPRPGIARMLANDEYRLFYREMFPPHEINGMQFLYLSVMLRKSWMPPQDLPFVPLLATPGPQGAVVQIPWHIVAGTPPMPGSVEPGRYAELSDPALAGSATASGAPAPKIGCWNIISLIIWIMFGIGIIGGILMKLGIL